jgi:hypothetical protein
MKLVDIWDIDQNFWQLNPQLKLAFKDIYDGDKTKDKKDSSRLMWAIALFIDPGSKFCELPEYSREDLIKRDYFNTFSLKEHGPIIEKWKSFLSPAQRQLILWNKFMDEKNAYMTSLNYKENGDEIEKRLLSNTNLFKEFVRISALIAEEETDGLVKGGAVESLSEKGDI